MDDSLMFDYLMQMGALRPDEEELKRKQAMVDALRKGSMQSPEGQMIGKHYVAPSITQYGAQLMNAYGARQGQQGVDEKLRGLNDQQRQMLEEMRRRRRGAPAPAMGYSSNPYSNLPTNGNVLPDGSIET